MLGSDAKTGESAGEYNDAVAPFVAAAVLAVKSTSLSPISLRNLIVSTAHSIRQKQPHTRQSGNTLSGSHSSSNIHLHIRRTGSIASCGEAEVT